MKKLISVFLCAVLVVGTLVAFAGCTKTQDLKYDVVLITDGGSIHDKGYNQSAWEGIQAYAESADCTANYYQPAFNEEEGETLTTDLIADYVKLAVDKGAKYIVFPGDDFAVAAFEMASAYPDVNFILLDALAHSEGDTSVRLMPNIMSVSFDNLQAGYLAGFSAVLSGNTKLGYFGSVQNSQSSNYGGGFVQGAAAAADALAVPVTLDYADYDSALLDYSYNVNIKPVYEKVADSTNTYHKVVVENGIGTGVYKVGQNVTIACDEYTADGKKFDHWDVKSNTEGIKDKKVNISSDKKTEINLIIEECDCTLTAVYADTEDKVATATIQTADQKDVYDTVSGCVDTTVSVSAPPASKGMVFDHWTTTGSEDKIEDINASTTNVTLEENGVTLTPVYKVSTDPTFEVVVENGTGSGSYLTNDEVHIVANAPEDGYYFSGWELTDADGNSTGIALANEFYYDTTFTMVDRYAAIVETMIDEGVKALFAGGNEKSESLYTARNTFDLSDVTIIGSGVNEENANYSVVKEYGKAVQACLNDFKGATIYNANCANECLTCRLPDGDNKEELQKQLDAVYAQLADGTIKPNSIAPGADVRKCFTSSCLSLDYWIFDTVEEAEAAGAVAVEAEAD